MKTMNMHCRYCAAMLGVFTTSRNAPAVGYFLPVCQRCLEARADYTPAQKLISPGGEAK